MKIPSSLDITIRKIEIDLRALLNEQSDFEGPWRSMINYILNARGHFISDTAGKKRELVSKKILNNAGKEAASTLAAALQSGITPQDSNWIKLTWQDEGTKTIEPLVRWLDMVQNITLDQFGNSNFYDASFIYYMDLSVICTAAMHSGEGEETPLVFDNYAVGEYVFHMTSENKPDPFIQVRWMTLKSIIEKYGENNLPDTIDTKSDNKLDIHYPIVKATYKKKHRGRNYVSIHYMRNAKNGQRFDQEDGALLVKTYESCPNHIGRWDILPGENLALGPGFDALSHVRRLQEQERTFQMMAHKMADPPVNVPAELRGKADLLPGGQNHIRNDKKITPIYDRMGELNVLLAAIERTEERIGKAFFNDIFLTSSRDPNASPLRTGQVNQIRDESLIKIGPVVGRIFKQTIEPLVERSINTLLRKGIIPPPPEEFKDFISPFKIELVSPLAQAMKLLQGRAIQQVLTQISGLAQFDTTVLDKINFDRTVDILGDISGSPLEIFNTEDEVERIRIERREQQAAAQRQQQQLIAQQTAQQQRESDARVAKDLSSAGEQLNEITQENVL